MVGEKIAKIEPKEPKIWEEIKRQVSEVRYGAVQITIHDGNIVQVETSKKIRF